jgi:23S rRNA maturation-related 3'-5' exoribonuclease YhaM
MFISKAEKESFHHMIAQLQYQVRSLTERCEDLSESYKNLKLRVNEVSVHQIAKVTGAAKANTKNDKDIEILKNQNIALLEDIKSLSKKFEALQERYEAETGKHLITRNRVSLRKKNALTAISEIKGVKVEQKPQETK